MRLVIYSPVAKERSSSDPAIRQGCRSWQCHGKEVTARQGGKHNVGGTRKAGEGGSKKEVTWNMEKTMDMWWWRRMHYALSRGLDAGSSWEARQG